MANFQFSVRLKSRPPRTLTARDGEGWSLFSAIVNWRESFHGMLKSGSSSRNNPEYPLTGWRCVVSVCVECVLFLSPESEVDRRSEEHTSELQSHSDLVCRLLLAKKKTYPAPQAMVQPSFPASPKEEDCFSAAGPFA